MSKAEELRKNIAGSLGLQYERRGVEEFFLVAYRHVDDLIQAVRDEERSKTCPVCAGLPPVGSISELIWKCDKCGSELLSIFYQRLSPVLFPFPLRDLPAGGEVPKEEVKE